jgi:hypothetical protein
MKKLRLVSHRSIWLLLVLTLILTGCFRQNVPATEDPQADASSSDETSLAAMEIIEDRVSELRGLETLKPVTKAFLTTDQLRQKLEDDFAEDYTEQEARDDVLLYAAFEFMETDVDLFNLMLDLYTEQVAGFYDPETEEMFVIKGDQEPGATERMTFSHEYTHALQDQHYDLEELGFTDEEEVEDSEAQFAVRSLVEGDATLLMQQYMLQYFDADDLMEVIDQSVGLDTNVLDSAPAVIRETLMFPYDAGFRFVTAIFQNGGWSAVDEAYANPPVSTEQILHPEHYPDDKPQIVALPPLTDTLGEGWRLIDNDVMGEFGTQLYLKVYLDPSEAERASEGWGGDRYAVHWRADESAFVVALRLAWDASVEASEFFDAYTHFAETRFGDGPTRSEGNERLLWVDSDALLLAQNDQSETLVLIAPDEVTLAALLALFPEFQ